MIYKQKYRAVRGAISWVVRMHVLLSAFCAVSANLDTVAVCAAFGMKKVKIRFPAALAISLISTLGTFLSMLAGMMIISRFNTAALARAGAAILMGMGVWFIYTGTRELIGGVYTPAMLSHPEAADSNHSGSIELKESVALAFALTVNNLSVGIAAGAAGLNICATTIFTFLFTFLSMIIGAAFGKSFLARWLGKYASLLSGCVIFIIGLASAFWG